MILKIHIHTLKCDAMINVDVWNATQQMSFDEELGVLAPMGFWDPLGMVLHVHGCC